MEPNCQGESGTTKVIMQERHLFPILVLGFALAASSVGAQPAKDKKSLDVLHGPATARLGDIAKIEIPDGYSFLDGKTTRALLKASGEPTSGNELGFIRP